jgi:cytochrome c biogenesis protein CcmG, thiol:disulfide interchange protein DsbE
MHRAATALVSLALVAAACASPAEEVSPAAANSVPTVAFERFDGEPATLAEWHGEPLVVNFWASWCPPCVAEMRDAFEPLHRDLGREVTFLGVNLQDTDEAALEVVEQTGVTYELARDPDGELFTAFGAFGMPTTVFVDADGTVTAQHTGALTAEALDGLIRAQLLEG